ncbi:MAG: hypothetical protein ABFD83_07790 [Armatimonadota bacterium]
MLKVHGRRAGIAFWTLAMMALIVCMLALIQVYVGPGKEDANCIISPWNYSHAPPQSISGNNVKINACAKFSAPHPQKSVKVTCGIRTAGAAAVLN